MKNMLWLLGIFSLAALHSPAEDKPFPCDRFTTSAGEMKITFIGHGSLMIEIGTVVIHVDPYSILADYAVFPKADVLLITHDHPDHLDMKAIGLIKKNGMTIVCPEKCLAKLSGAVVLSAGGQKQIKGITLTAVPAYNIINKRPTGEPFHPKGEGIGYVLSVGGKNVYVAGDTENTAEMKALKNIDIAFLPMNLPFTMTPAMVADAAKAFRPKILYPYHYGQTDPNILVKLLQAEKDIEVRVRPMR